MIAGRSACPYQLRCAAGWGRGAACIATPCPARVQKKRRGRCGASHCSFARGVLRHKRHRHQVHLSGRLRPRVSGALETEPLPLSLQHLLDCNQPLCHRAPHSPQRQQTIGQPRRNWCSHHAACAGRAPGQGTPLYTLLAPFPRSVPTQIHTLAATQNANRSRLSCCAPRRPPLPVTEATGGAATGRNDLSSAPSVSSEAGTPAALLLIADTG